MCFFPRRVTDKNIAKNQGDPCNPSAAKDWRSSDLIFDEWTFIWGSFEQLITVALRLHGMSWGVKTTCFKALFGVSLGGSGVSIGGVRSLRVIYII